MACEITSCATCAGDGGRWFVDIAGEREFEPCYDCVMQDTCAQCGEQMNPHLLPPPMCDACGWTFDRLEPLPIA